MEDFGEGNRTNNVATAALVFMARGIKENWKQPLGYVLVNESCPSDLIKDKLFEIIDELTSMGLLVETILSDLGSNFQKLLRELNVTPTTPWILHNGKKIIYLFDPPHLIKAVRNNLLKHDFHFDGKVASWDDIKTVYHRDKQQSLRCCPKLTQKHISPNGFTKMKVKYATQVMSHTVGSTLCMYIALGALPPSAVGTAELIANMDNIFDCLNSSSLNSTKIYKKALSEDSAHHKFIDDMLPFIQSIKVINRESKEDVTNKLRCLKGLQLTLNGVLALWDTLHKDYGLDFLLTRRLNQDPLENFFGLIRQQGGNCDNPTPLQFTRAFRKLFVDNFLTPLLSGNCAEDFDAYLVKSHTTKSDTPAAQDQPIPPHSTVEDTDYNTNEVGQNLVSINPTPLQFTRAFRKLFVDNFLTPLLSGNCAEDFDAYLVKSHTTKSDTPAAQDQPIPPHSTVEDTDYNTNEVGQNLVSINAVTYVSGYLLKKCLTKHPCDMCRRTCTTTSIDDSSQLFCMFKTFEGIDNGGGLTVPQDMFVQHVTQMEDIFINEFNKSIHRKNIGSYLCAQMPALPKTYLKCQNFPVTYMIKLFVKMRLHYALKFGNQELTAKNRKSRKYIKVQHL